jgi:glycogen phosphorylase
VGDENIFIFGLTAEEVSRAQRERSYDPWTQYRADSNLRRVIDALAGDRFCPDQPGHFRPIHDRLMRRGDEYFHLADFAAYVAAQDRASETFLEKTAWAKKANFNVARVGKFSSDRTIAEYARDIWGVDPVV